MSQPVAGIRENLANITE